MQNDKNRVMRDVVRAGVDREYVATGDLVNCYQPTEPEYPWCQERIQELRLLRAALGSSLMLRLMLKIHQ